MDWIILTIIVCQIVALLSLASMIIGAAADKAQIKDLKSEIERLRVEKHGDKLLEGSDTCEKY